MLSALLFNQTVTMHNAAEASRGRLPGVVARGVVDRGVVAQDVDRGVVPGLGSQDKPIARAAVRGSESSGLGRDSQGMPWDNLTPEGWVDLHTPALGDRILPPHQGHRTSPASHLLHPRGWDQRTPCCWAGCPWAERTESAPYDHPVTSVYVCMYI